MKWIVLTIAAAGLAGIVHGFIRSGRAVFDAMTLAMWEILLGSVLLFGSFIYFAAKTFMVIQ